MDKMIIYTHNSEILIVANADNVNLLCEYVGLLTNKPFSKCNFSCYIDNSENKIYVVSIHRGRYHFRKRYTAYRIAKTKYKLLSTDNFCLAIDVLGLLIEQSTL
jgi:hypothetical protein